MHMTLCSSLVSIMRSGHGMQTTCTYMHNNVVCPMVYNVVRAWYWPSVQCNQYYLNIHCTCVYIAGWCVRHVMHIPC